ncbi:hypothetical protein F4821DRAFT_245803 [Hypoxylon rubiginosum]|uniref:Uncharacterized protein n=1 Tax=Hypoxylon rubiginosum TaxID=110542 RepID=A0ACC0CRB2_9PEZI|nr:hypothetical protein F4821DRAFT_245803 [Hypoxylon rubiginosum]
MWVRSSKSRSCFFLFLYQQPYNIVQMASLLSTQSTISMTDGSHDSCGVESSTTSFTEYRIPGYLVNPENLVRVLRERFNDNYKVKLRNDNYSISTPRKLTKNEIILCY